VMASQALRAARPKMATLLLIAGPLPRVGLSIAGGQLIAS
jgi:hypothetical protein